MSGFGLLFSVMSDGRRNPLGFETLIEQKKMNSENQKFKSCINWQRGVSLHAESTRWIVKRVGERMFICKRLFPLLELCCFVEKQPMLLNCLLQRFSRTTNKPSHLGCVPFHTAHREAMDWFVLLGRLFKNMPSCDAQRAAPEAGIQPRPLLYKWSGLHWFKVYTINAISAGDERVTAWMSMSDELSFVTVTVLGQKSGARYWSGYESLQITLPSQAEHFLKNTGGLWNNELRNKLWPSRSGTHTE